MKQIDTIRAALEQAGEYIRSDLASERGAFEGHEGVSRIDEIKADLANNAAALAALAELERAAAEPVATVCLITDRFAHNHCIEAQLQVDPGAQLPIGTKLYAAPPAPVAEIREAVVTDAVARKVFNGWIDARWRLNEGQDTKYGHAMINVVRAELGPALGLVEIREPTPEECERIYWTMRRGDYDPKSESSRGRAMFDAVRAVLWPKEGL